MFMFFFLELARGLHDKPLSKNKYFLLNLIIWLINFRSHEGLISFVSPLYSSYADIKVFLEQFHVADLESLVVSLMST